MDLWFSRTSAFKWPVYQPRVFVPHGSRRGLVADHKEQDKAGGSGGSVSERQVGEVSGTVEAGLVA